jgi:hypothetical protein
MRWIIPALLAMLCYLPDVEAAAAKKGSPSPAPTTGCASCHPDFASVLPVGHPAVAGKDIPACFGCHQPDTKAKPAANPFAARLHRVHATKTTLECTVCHTWRAGKSFGLRGAKVSFGAPDKAEMESLRDALGSWANSGFLDSMHAKRDITCAACHGATLPTKGDAVENERCLACHGPAEQLAARTQPAEFPDRNPHKSHLGEIACTVCHHGHAASKVYCLECHAKFSMTIAGGTPEGGR